MVIFRQLRAKGCGGGFGMRYITVCYGVLSSQPYGLEVAYFGVLVNSRCVDGSGERPKKMNGKR